MPKLINRAGALQAPEANSQTQPSLVLPADHDPIKSGINFHQHKRIAIEFPNFTDGRGYSIARLLRTRLNYQGELHAVGDVLVDQLQLMARCGFSHFSLRDDQSPEVAQRTLTAFSRSYQASHPL